MLYKPFYNKDHFIKANYMDRGWFLFKQTYEGQIMLLQIIS